MHVMIQARVRDVRVNHKLSLKRADLSSSIKKQKKKKRRKKPWLSHGCYTCDVINYKTKHRSLTKCRKTKIKIYLRPLS